jgi:hypothetical protein
MDLNSNKLDDPFAGSAEDLAKGLAEVTELRQTSRPETREPQQRPPHPGARWGARCVTMGPELGHRQPVPADIEFPPSRFACAA